MLRNARKMNRPLNVPGFRYLLWNDWRFGERFRMPQMPTSNPIHTMMDYPLTLTAILERAGRYFAGTEIVSRLPDRSVHRYYWGRLRERALRLAECLLSLGLKRGDRVATLMW